MSKVVVSSVESPLLLPSLLSTTLGLDHLIDTIAFCAVLTVYRHVKDKKPLYFDISNTGEVSPTEFAMELKSGDFSVRTPA